MKKKKAEKPTYNMPLRRQSFSDFSQSYSNGLNKKNMSYGEKMRRRRTIYRILAVLGFIALFIAGYVTITVMLDISKTPAGASPAALKQPAAFKQPAFTVTDSRFIPAEAADALYSL